MSLQMSFVGCSVAAIVNLSAEVPTIQACFDQTVQAEVVCRPEDTNDLLKVSTQSAPLDGRN